MQQDEVKQAVKEHYANIAKKDGADCCGQSCECGGKSLNELIACCVGGALLKDDYLKCAEDAGFKVKILSEDKDISKRQYRGFPLESLKIEAEK